MGSLLKDLSIREWQSINPVFKEDIYEKLIPKQVVASRLSQGGTGFERVSEQLANWRNHFSSLKE